MRLARSYSRRTASRTSGVSSSSSLASGSKRARCAHERRRGRLVDWRARELESDSTCAQPDSKESDPLLVSHVAVLELAPTHSVPAGFEVHSGSDPPSAPDDLPGFGSVVCMSVLALPAAARHSLRVGADPAWKRAAGMVA
jgi:hypothetical protein